MYKNCGLLIFVKSLPYFAEKPNVINKYNFFNQHSLYALTTL